MLGEFKTTIIDRLSRVETKIDHLEYRFDKLENSVDDLKHRTSRLESVVVEIQSVLKDKGFPIHQPLLSPGSPLKLTRAGEELVKRYDGYSFVEANKDFFVVLLEKKNPSTSYDVQEMAKKVLEESISHPIFNPIKKIVYEEGSNIEPVLSVLGIILRDTYLKTHPEIQKWKIQNFPNKKSPTELKTGIFILYFWSNLSRHFFLFFLRARSLNHITHFIFTCHSGHSAIR